jgi:hypothetical protein
VDVIVPWPQVATPWKTSVPPFIQLGVEPNPWPLQVSMRYFIFPLSVLFLLLYFCSDSFVGSFRGNKTEPG